MQRLIIYFTTIFLHFYSKWSKKESIVVKTSTFSEIKILTFSKSVWLVFYFWFFIGWFDCHFVGAVACPCYRLDARDNREICRVVLWRPHDEPHCWYQFQLATDDRLFSVRIYCKEPSRQLQWILVHLSMRRDNVSNLDCIFHDIYQCVLHRVQGCSTCSSLNIELLGRCICIFRSQAVRDRLYCRQRYQDYWFQGTNEFWKSDVNSWCQSCFA